VKPTVPLSPCGRPSSALDGSLDHFIRLEEEERRYGDPQGFGGFEIDDQLELEIGAWTGSSFGLATLRIRSA